jgi:hypothetical protein
MTPYILGPVKKRLDSYPIFRYNGINESENTCMKQEEFRTFMMQNLREFDSWAWKDRMKNPGDWNDLDTKESWLDMFVTYIGVDKID